MAEDYLDPLQGIVRHTIREELSRLEPRFQRITMSQDTDGHPAELYGAGGKIYYRKDGDLAGVELDAGGASGSLWESPGAVTELIAPEPVLLEDDLTLYDGTSLSPELELKAYAGEGMDGVYMTSSTEYFWINRIFDDSILARCDLSSQKWRLYNDLELNYNDLIDVKVVKGYSTLDLSFWDTATGTKTLSELAASSSLWQVDGAETQLITADSIDMQGHNILDIGNVQFGAADIATIEKDASSNLDIKSATGKNIAFKPSGGATAVLRVYGSSIAAYQNLNMGGTKTVEGLIAATANGQAVRYEQLANYYTQTAIDTWRNSVTQAEMGYVNGVTSAIQTQLAARLPLAGGTMVSEAGINMNMGYLSEIGSLKGGVGWDWTFWGSNAWGTGLNEMMRWDASEQDIKVASGVDLNMSNSDVIGVKVLKANGVADLSFWDNTNGTKTLSQLAAGGGAYLPLAGGVMSGHIDMAGSGFLNAAGLTVYADVDGFELVESAGWTTEVTLASSTYALEAHEAGIHMHGHDIIGVDEIKGVTNVNLYVKPQGTGILYLG